MDEKGYIKFNCNWIKSKILPCKSLKGLNNCRDELYREGLVGAYKNGIGFGNLSMRCPNGFIITGSATGSIKKLTKENYTFVKDFDFDNNCLTCIGPIRASSESLTHAAIYEISPETKAVIHVHSYELWKDLINKAPTTKKQVEYGTPEMAYEIERLFKETDVRERRIIAMGGHREGVISFGRDLKEAMKVLRKYQKSRKI